MINRFGAGDTRCQNPSRFPALVCMYVCMYRIRLIFHGDFISRKREKVGFTKFSRFLSSRMGVWASFPDVLNLNFFAGFNFANGHRLAKYTKLNPPRNLRRIQYVYMCVCMYVCMYVCMCVILCMYVCDLQGTVQ